jgi:hypothetical protein
VALVRERTIPSELPSLVGKLVPTFADRQCYVFSITEPYGRILGFPDHKKKQIKCKMLICNLTEYSYRTGPYKVYIDHATNRMPLETPLPVHPSVRWTERTASYLVPLIAVFSL